MFHEWAEKHETAILLNGGDAGKLRGLVKLMEHKGNPYPWAKFNESKMSLDRTMTCVCVVLPPKMYETQTVDAARHLLPDHEKGPGDFKSWEMKFLKFKGMCPMAH